MNHIYIITGDQGEGKTTMIKHVISELRQAKVKTDGFIAEGTWKDGIRDDFLLVRISNDWQIPLCRSKPKEGYQQLGRFWFNPEAIRAGEEILNSCLVGETEVIVLDEIGIFELEGEVWHDAFVRLLQSDKPVIISVRRKLKDKVLDKFAIKNYSLLSVGESYSHAAGIIRKSLKSN